MPNQTTQKIGSFYKITFVLALISLAVGIYTLFDSRFGEKLFPEECSETICEDSVTIRSIDSSIGPTSLLETYIECEEGEKVTGGGFKTIDDHKLFVWKNAPVMDGKGWGIGISNYGSSTRSVTIYAICVKVK